MEQNFIDLGNKFPAYLLEESGYDLSSPHINVKYNQFLEKRRD